MKLKIQMGARELVELGRGCGPGQIMRHGFTRKDGVYVPPGCVKDQGARGRTPASKRILPQPKAGMLKGWEAKKSAEQRHASLRKAVKAEGCRNVINRLSLERGFTKTTSPKTAATAKKDWQWLRKQGFCKLKTK
jgi:hypothetical protein